MHLDNFSTHLKVKNFKRGGQSKPKSVFISKILQKIIIIDIVAKVKYIWREPMNEKTLDKNAATEKLNRILELELAGVVRYTHYALMVYGYNRIPIIAWMREQAVQSLGHAQEAGELITHLGGHPSLAIGPLLETEQHDIGDILHESLTHEGVALQTYRELLALVEGHSVLLEDYARRMITEEEMHQGEVDKMMRRPGEIRAFSSPQS